MTMSPRAAASLLAALALALAVGACGAAAPGARPSATPSTIITDVDSGRTVQLAVGEVAALRLADRATWSEPRVAGGAVRVTHSGHDRAAGYDEWLIVATGRGTATLTSAGRVACAPGGACPDVLVAFSISVAVT